MIFARPIFAWTFWLTTLKIDRFVDLAGRDVINYSLNNLVMLLWSGVPLVLIFLVLALGNFSSAMPSKDNIINMFYGVSFGILFCIEIAYLIHAIISGIFAI